MCAMWMPYEQYQKLGWRDNVVPFRKKLPPPRPSKFHTTLEQHQRGKLIHNLKWGFPLKKKSAIDPGFLQDWIKHNGPYLYHCTSPDAARAILKEGLYPHDMARPSQVGNWQDEEDPLTPGEIREYPEDYVPSRSPWSGNYLEPRQEHVYLGTHKYAATYGTHMLKVDLRRLDPSLINADEDHFVVRKKIRPTLAHEQYIDSLHEFDPPIGPYDWDNDQETLGQWADRVIGPDPEAAMHSINSGSVAYNGHVPPEAISNWNLFTDGMPANAKVIEPVQGPQIQNQPGQQIAAAWHFGKTDAKHFEAKMFHHSDKGLLRKVEVPFLAHESQHPTKVNHPVSITLRHPVHVFVPLNQDHIDAALGVGADGVVSHTSDGTSVAVLDDGAVVPGHEHSFPYA